MFDDQTSTIGTIIPHADYGDPECCGCLVGIVNGNTANITCNECGIVLRTVAASELQKTLNEMEIGLDLATVLCPFCRNVNLFPGFTEIHAFVCQRCGSGVELDNTLKLF